MSLNTIIGQAARGDKYFPRPRITNEILSKLDSGSNLLLVAPRRVGKSSIVLNLYDNPPERFIVIYYFSESVNSENEFFKKMLHHLWERFSGVQKYKSMLATGAKEFSSYIESIGLDGVNFRQNSSVDYYEELKKFLKVVPDKTRIVVFIDEYASTVENIIRDESKSAAIHFLASNRSLRQAPEVQGKIQFVYAGSIGLENIVGRMNCINLINDLAPVNIPPLNEEEAKRLTDKILESSGICFADNAFDYLCSTIEWLIPYYLQITLDEAYQILPLYKPANVITKAIIDESIKNALAKRIYFEHWFTRLRSAYSGDEFRFIKDLLNQITAKRTLSSSEIIDLAFKYNLSDSYNDLVNSLKHDGYINNSDSSKIYRFNSYLLREWWNANVAN
ncbi:MAG: hypothetical protein WCW53_08495 [Syntrophales bacterium]